MQYNNNNNNNNNNNILKVPAKFENSTAPVKPGGGWKENRSIY